VTPPLGRGFARLWAASTISNLGDGVTLVAMPLLAATLTRSPSTVALVTVFGRLPWLGFALVGGALTDRLDRRLLMANTDLFRMVVIGGFGAVVLADGETIALLCVVAFVLGAAECLFDNASQAILPMVVPKDALEVANGRTYAAEIVTNQFAGPPAGAALFAVTAAAPFLLDAASFGIAALLVLTLAGTFRAPRTRHAPMHTEIAEGLVWLARHRLLRTFAIALGVMNLLFEACMAIFVLYALEELDLSKEGYGLLLAAGAVGALAGSLAGAPLSRRIGPGRTAVGSVFMMGAAAVVPAVWANTFAVAVALTVIGMFGVTWNVVTVSLRQAIIPTELLGRVNSTYRLLGWGTMPIGAALGGVLAEVFGLRAPFYVNAVLTLALACAISPIVTNRAVAEARATT
jgi:MFS family permease